jgi:hypothetical protein
MSRKTDWPVTEDDVRPARPDGTCFYCEVPLGGQHDPECVCRERQVVIDMTIRLVVEVPEAWDRENIEFKYNDSSYCLSNLMDTIEEADDRGCLCHCAKVDYVGEADDPTIAASPRPTS